jgi:hypothetical protein
MMALTDVAHFKHSVSTAIMRIEHDVPCMLHLHTCLTEKILSFIMVKSLGEKEKNKSVRLRHGEKMSKILNENAFGCNNAPGNYSVPMYEIQGIWERLNSMMGMQMMWRKLFPPSFQNC